MDQPVKQQIIKETKRFSVIISTCKYSSLFDKYMTT